MWNIEVNEVLKRWIGDAPEADDPVLQALTEDTIILLDLKVEKINERLINNSNLQKLLNIVVSAAVQRAYNSDYSAYSSQSFSTGPFSESYSKSSNSKQGIYFTTEEIELLRDKEILNNTTGVISISNPAQPNFSFRRGFSYDCWD